MTRAVLWHSTKSLPHTHARTNCWRYWSGKEKSQSRTVTVDTERAGFDCPVFTQHWSRARLLVCDVVIVRRIFHCPTHQHDHDNGHYTRYARAKNNTNANREHQQQWQKQSTFQSHTFAENWRCIYVRQQPRVRYDIWLVLSCTVEATKGRERDETFETVWTACNLEKS